MFKLLTVIGARPQIIKAAALSRVLRQRFSSQFCEVIVHTGQHYDAEMSAVFFQQLGVPEPGHTLQVGGVKRAVQIARMIEGLDKVLTEERPDAVIVYGDTNSTLAGALSSAMHDIPVVHIEAGLRSFCKQMPEELNRVLTDHASTLLFTPTRAGLANLEREGLAPAEAPYSADRPGVFHCGDIMLDNTFHYAGIAEANGLSSELSGRIPTTFLLLTLHRQANTDNAERLNAILKALCELADKGYDIVFPVHPRTRKAIENASDVALSAILRKHPRIHLIDPVSYLDILLLQKQASLVLTDSGGLQKEAFWMHTPVVILREETEWVELLEMGVARLAGADTARIVASVTDFLSESPDFNTLPPVYGDGKAADFILHTLSGFLQSRRC